MTVRTTPLGRLLYASTFLISTCGLIYELVAGALASYLLGDSVTQFSLVIGAYLSAMGVGSWLSRHIEGNLVARFVEIEIAVALLGGFEAPLLFAGFTWTPAFRGVLYILVALVGVGVGLEPPLLIRILETRTTLKELVARVLFLDYIGALAASLLFPLFPVMAPLAVKRSYESGMRMEQSWELLPAELGVVRLSLSPGTHTVSLPTLRGLEARAVDVKAGVPTVLVTRAP